MQAIRKDFMPEDLAPLLKAKGIDGCVAVQADQSENETRFLLELADQHGFVKKVVGWVDLAATDIEERLAYWKQHPRLCGFRHILQAEPPEKMKDKAFRHGLSKLAAQGFTYDILIYPKHLDAALDLVDTFPDQAFVIDHLAKPGIRQKQLEPWRKQILEMAQRPNVFCKLSGMVTEASLASWQPSDLLPFMDVALAGFGAGRLMFGSDWPVCLLASDYNRVVDVVESFIRELNPEEQEQIMGGTAARFYGITN